MNSMQIRYFVDKLEKKYTYVFLGVSAGCQYRTKFSFGHLSLLISVIKKCEYGDFFFFSKTCGQLMVPFHRSHHIKYLNKISWFH